MYSSRIAEVQPTVPDDWYSSDALDASRPPVLIIGLGNPILGDDGAGWRVAEKVAQQLNRLPAILSGAAPTPEPASPPQVEVACLSVGGLTLMERMIGYKRVIIIDALETGQYPPGKVVIISLADLPDRALGHLCSAHDTTLQNALRVGRSMGAALPEKILVVGIEAAQVIDFSEQLTPDVFNAIPIAVEQVMELIK